MIICISSTPFTDYYANLGHQDTTSFLVLRVIILIFTVKEGREHTSGYDFDHNDK